MDNLAKVISIAKRPDLSLLRYPGGKRKLVPLLAEIILDSGDDIKLLIEPFAGGASASIAMMQAGVVKEIALADKDDLVASLWKVVFSNDAYVLADMIANTNADIDTWYRIKHELPDSLVGKAHKCLFLNRTSFSGILHKSAGPIGGKGQKSNYKIGCRFNRTILANRIIELSEYKNRVRFVRTQSYIKTLSDIMKTNISKENNNVFWYLDPPFVNKANKLYNYYFSLNEHQHLKKLILSNSFPGKWILSYDDTDISRQMYGNYQGFSRVNFAYNARVDTIERLVSSEIIVSNVIAERRISGEIGIPQAGEIIPSTGFSTNREQVLATMSL